MEPLRDAQRLASRDTDDIGAAKLEAPIRELDVEIPEPPLVCAAFGVDDGVAQELEPFRDR